VDVNGGVCALGAHFETQSFLTLESNVSQARGVAKTDCWGFHYKASKITGFDLEDRTFTRLLPRLVGMIAQQKR
jgi:hypothetical protein